MTLSACSSDVPARPLLAIGAPEYARACTSWIEHVTSLLRSAREARTPSQHTACAENGLRIVSRPYYLYASRTESAFGVAIFLYRESVDRSWPHDSFGATPFDSGGLWHGRICATGIDTQRDKERFFRANDIPLLRWTEAFANYIQHNYPSLREYILGQPPRIGTHPIVPRLPNSPRAWTWEVRVPWELMDQHLELVSCFMSLTDQQQYLDWLWSESKLEDSECLIIDRHIGNLLTPVPLGLTATALALNEILEEARR